MRLSLKIPLLSWTCGTITTTFAEVITSAHAPFAKAVDGQIVCSEIVKNEGIAIDEDGNIQSDHRFACIVDPVYTVSGSRYISLMLNNFDDMRQREWEVAEKKGKVRVTINEGSIEGSTLTLPSQKSYYKEATPPPFVTGNGRSLFRANKQCFVPVLKWALPDVATERRRLARKLAINQTGNRSINVLRITTATNGAPSASAASVSNQVFGTSGDTVTIASHYAECSNNQLDFYAKTVSGQTYSANGVIDVSITTDSSSTYTASIVNSVNGIVGDAYLDQLDHIFYHMPLGTETQSGGGTGWVAYANLVST